jgi:hypothetical protein
VTDGPFRHDARAEFVLDVPTSADSLRALRRADRPGIVLSTYLGIVAIATLGVGVGLAPHAVPAFPVGASVLFLAIWIGYQLATNRKKIAAEAGASRRCIVRDDGLELESGLGRSFWAWAAVRGVRRIPGAAVLDLVDGQALVLPMAGDPGARLGAWLEARLPREARTPRTRALLALAVLYLALAAAAATVLPALLPP